MDTPETLAADLVKAAATAAAAATKVVQVGAAKIKSEARRNSIASSGMSAAAAPHSIGYKTEVKRTSIEAVIGYGEGALSANKQAALGTLLEFGGGRDHSPPHRDLGRAMDVEEPRFLASMAEIGVTGLLGRGLR